MNHRSVCLYHNGNKQIIDHYREKLSYLEFCGNWAEEDDPNANGKLWEICYADANRENLIRANILNIHVLRHVTPFDNDQLSLLPECQPMDYDSWLTHVVCNNLIFCDEIVSDVKFNNPLIDQTVMITTGRTANSHFQQFLRSVGKVTFEGKKTVDDNLLESSSAVLMWRENHWEALSSIWLASQSNRWIHQINGCATGSITDKVNEISQDWIATDWVNMCQAVLDLACFFKLVLRRPISLMTTERSINEFRSSHSKISYDKSALIENYDQTKSQYQTSDTCELIESMYTRIKAVIPCWANDYDLA